MGLESCTCLVNLLPITICKQDLIFLHLYLADAFFLRHRHEGTVIDLLYSALCHIRYEQKIQHKQYAQDN